MERKIDTVYRYDALLCMASLDPFFPLEVEFEPEEPEPEEFEPEEPTPDGPELPTGLVCVASAEAAVAAADEADAKLRKQSQHIHSHLY